MRVICIEDSIWFDGPHAGSICTHKGSIYHVTGSVEGEELKALGVPAAGGPWYTFLEVSGKHHYVRFLELPDDDFEEGIQEEQIAIEEELAKLN
jgi:hypothetical protein